MSAVNQKRWKLKFVLPGLIAHVHDPANNRWYGMLVNSDSPGHALHEPQLRFANNDFAADQTGATRPKASDVVGDPSIPNGALIWKLSDVDIRIRPINGATLSPTLTPFHDAHPGPPAFEVLQDIGFLADMRQIHPQASQMDPVCFDPAPPPDRVVARFQLDHGLIGTYKFTEFENEPVTDWTFAPLSNLPGGGPVVGPVPVALVCEITVDDGMVLCEGTKFGSNDPRGFILDAPNGGEVTIRSSNCPKFFDPLDIVGNLQVDTDFLLYYKVSTLIAPADPFVPTRPDRPAFPRGGNCCGSTGFAPIS